MANSAKQWAENMTMTPQDMDGYGFQTIEKAEDPIPYANSISAYVDSLQSDYILEILQKSGLPQKSGMFFFGKKGTGKHKAATSSLATLLYGGVYKKWIWLTAEDFYDANEAETAKRIEAIFETFQSNSYKYLLLIELPETFPHSNILIETLTSCVLQCEENELDMPLLIITTEKSAKQYPRLCDRLMQFNFRPPNLQQRTSYLNQCYVYSTGKVLPFEYDKVCLSDMSVMDFAEMTQGINFSELTEIVSLSKLLAINKAIRSGVFRADDFILAKYPLSKSDILSLLPEANKSSQVVTQQVIHMTNAVAADGTAQTSQAQSQANDNARFSEANIKHLEALISDTVFNPDKRKLLRNFN